MDLHTKRCLSVIVPMKNEAQNVLALYTQLNQTISSIENCDMELICIDDGSHDDTLVELLKLKQQDSRLKIIELSRCFGKEAALSAGLDFVSGDAALPFDADLQDPVAVIPEMVEKWRAGSQIVLAKRINRQAESFIKRTTALLYYKLHNKLSKNKIEENVGDFRLLDKTVADQLKKMKEKNRFMKGIFSWVGYPSDCVFYVRDKRHAGNSHFNFFKLLDLAVEGLTGFSSIPLKVWTVVGFFISLVSFFYGVYVVFLTLFKGVVVPGYASLFVGLCFFSGIQLISLGIIGEYVARIYIETKQRPIYLIKDIY